MNAIEISGLSISLLVTVYYLKWLGFQSSRSLLLTALVLPALALAWHSVTDFLTIDELYAIEEPMHLRWSTLLVWRGHGHMHTTTALLAGPLQVLRKVFGLTDPIVKGIAKGLHLFAGYVLFLAIHRIVASLFIPERLRVLFFVIFSYAMLLLPTNLVALRIYQWDLLALSLAILSYFILMDAWLNSDRKKCIVAIVVAALAAQEKLSASPFLLLAMIAYTILASRSRSLYSVAAGVVQANLIACAVYFVTGLVAVGSGAAARLVFSPPWVLFYPSIAWAIPIFATPFAGGSAIEHYPRWTLALQLGIPALAALVFDPLANRLRQVEWTKPMRLVISLAVGTVAVLGLCGTFFVDSYFDPWVPIAPGNFVPQEFNGMRMHFGAISAATHKLAAVAWSVAVFLIAVPTPFWAGVALVFLLPKAIWPDQRTYLALLLTLLAALALPFAHGLSPLPVVNRYLQISICLLACVASILFTLTMASLSARKRVWICTAVIAGVFLEMRPFSPLYAAFRPIWANYEAEYNSSPIVGRPNPSWIGWGEEAMIAGRMIREACTSNAVHCDDVRIYCSYAGDWVFPGPGIEVHCANPRKENALRFTDQDFYVVNRSSVVQGGFFPENVKPWQTIEFRGFVQAWIFRGDQIKDSEFQLR